MNFSTGHAVVDSIGKLHVTGNLVHHSWYQHVRYSNKRGEFTDPWAVLILADIVYWYRPIEVRDEQTGHLIGYRKKFSEDKLQRSPSAFSKLLCCSEKVVRDALTLLESIGLIDIELRSVSTGFGVVPTAMFIGLNPARVHEITHNTSMAGSTEKPSLPKSVTRLSQMGREATPNGQGGMPKSDSHGAEMGYPSIYKEFSKDFSQISQREQERGDGLNPNSDSEEKQTTSIFSQQNQPIDSKDSNAIRESKYSAPACDNNVAVEASANKHDEPKELITPSPIAPKVRRRIDGSEILPWESANGRSSDSGFEQWMLKSLSKCSFYQGLMPGEALTQVRKHIAAGRFEEKRKCELLIEWEAYQADLLRREEADRLRQQQPHQPAIASPPPPKPKIELTQEHHDFRAKLVAQSAEQKAKAKRR